MNGQIVIDFNDHKMQKYLPGKHMLKGEWMALQIMKKLIREKNFPVVYKEILEKRNSSWFSQVTGFNLISITYKT